MKLWDVLTFYMRWEIYLSTWGGRRLGWDENYVSSQKVTAGGQGIE